MKKKWDRVEVVVESVSMNGHSPDFGVRLNWEMIQKEGEWAELVWEIRAGWLEKK